MVAAIGSNTESALSMNCPVLAVASISSFVFSEIFIYKKMFLRFFGISRFLERILMEYIDIKDSLDSKLQIHSIYCIRILSRNRDMIEKPMHFKNFKLKTSVSTPV